MSIKKQAFWCGGILLLGLAGCLGPMPPRVSPVPPPVPEVVPVPVPGPVEIPTAEKGRLAALWVPGPRTDALASARFLAQRPDLRVTVLFPDHFFGPDEKSKEAKILFRTLVSSKQIEVVLTLPDRPVLPLLMDTENARASSPTIAALPPVFAWPDDVVDQIGFARESFRGRWRAAPMGIQLPWDVALGPEFPLLARFKLRWALVSSSGPLPSVIEEFKIPVIRPALFPFGPAPRKEWFKANLQPILVSSGIGGPFQIGAVEDLAVLETLAGGPGAAAWVLMSEAMAEGPPPGIVRSTASSVDFTPWIGDAEENRAWELLGGVRRSVNEYQNSGAANLRSLDLAKRTFYSAESGTFFDHFGAERETAREEDLKRDFMATLSQVYRLMGQPVPPEIRQGFARGGRAGPAGEEADGGFERVGTALRWRDPANDDRGPGDYFYPTGAQFPTGAWDLRGFEVQPAEEDLTFVFEFTALPNPGGAPGGFSLPLIDVYMDINHSPGAGSQELLPGRPGMAEAGDAWEYALSADGWGARLFQSAPGQTPRSLGFFTVVKTSATAFSVTIPRRYWRGEPEAWGFAVAVFGRSPGGAVPMTVAVEPSPSSFGGAMAGRAAPPYIDLLVLEGGVQRRILGAYKAGQDITLPFVRAE